jgi:hypothetical protein
MNVLRYLSPWSQSDEWVEANPVAGVAAAQPAERSRMAGRYDWRRGYERVEALERGPCVAAWMGTRCDAVPGQAMPQVLNLLDTGLVRAMCACWCR